MLPPACSRSPRRCQAAKPAIRDAAAHLGADPAAQARPSDFAQALFDLGATVCTSAAPGCVLCPWIAECAGRRSGIAERLPARAEKPERPLRHGAHFWLTDASNNVLLRRRPASGLLGGMTELPGTAWRPEPWSVEEALQHAPMPADWRVAGEVRHGFTHFVLRVSLFCARVDRIEAEGFLRPIVALEDEAMPSLMRKCTRLAPGPVTP